ncbi:related to DNA polymerase IV, DNA-damage-inducibile protein dinP [Cephalotrichum gorgonifer]|uniref:DNA polymerase kappa n=1 Tax=Cephalotrichum gorgonifer TaxID=2041049 RepID=A0AAE8SYR4_9PEZI|nr:related to DNA polymerase IV, DNA-damage-inducibile protein dinP [Cephalotrichum gorgonifer]
MTRETEPSNPPNVRDGTPELPPPTTGPEKQDGADADPDAERHDHDTLKYQLLGPSLTKAGQDSVDQTKVAEIIYNTSKGSKFFNHEEARDKVLTTKIALILERKAALAEHQVARYVRDADTYLAQLEVTRDLSQHIVHVDCDAFFAAVEELDRPELKDIPFAVGRGVLTTCNYHARRFGVRSGMAAFVAKKLCPSLTLISNNHAKYSAKANEVRAVLANYDPRFESASIDEAYLNITAYCAANDIGPAEAVENLRREVHERTHVTVSAGIAANARLAKICSNLNKPNGQFVLPSERADIMGFMRSLSTRKVSGIGRVMERELAAVGISAVGDIYERRGYVLPLFGEKAYAFLMHVYLGLGRTQIRPAEEYERKSVGTERTFQSISDPEVLRAKLRQTAEELEKELAKAEVRGRTVVLKVKQHTFEVYTRQVVAGKQVYKAEDLYKLAAPMLAKLQEEVEGGLCVRLMGLRCTQLVGTKKPDAEAFFGVRSRPDVTRPDLDEDGWEKWPEELLGEADSSALSPGNDPFGDAKPDDEIGADDPDDSGPTADTTLPQGHTAEERAEFWDCPICFRPQPASERLLNEHIDLCLSRQTIRDAVQDTVPLGPPKSPVRPAAAPADSSGTGKRKRGRPRAGEASGEGDPRQRKLCFG